MTPPLSWQWKPSGTDSLCQLAGRWNGTPPIGGICVEEKHDGWRGLYFPGVDGKARLWTRNGHAIEGVPHILHRLAIMEQVAGQPMFFDGEFIVDNSLAATKAWCESGWKGGGYAGTLHLFDAMPLADWKAGRCDAPWIQRKAALFDLAEAAEQSSMAWDWAPGVRGDTPHSVNIVPDIWLADADDVWAEAQRVWARGGEGLMLKDAEAPYIRGRNDYWLKVKRAGER